MKRFILLAGVFLAAIVCAAANARALGAAITFCSDRDGDNEIYSMDADGGNVVQLTFNSSEDYATTCSPDGRRVAFYSNRDGNFEIYVMNVDGSGVQRLTNNPASDYAPDWSRDGYVAGDLFQVVDITTPASPSIVGSVATPGYAWGVTVSGDYAYVAATAAGLQIVMRQCNP